MSSQPSSGERSTDGAFAAASDRGRSPSPAVSDADTGAGAKRPSDATMTATYVKAIRCMLWVQDSMVFYFRSLEIRLEELQLEAAHTGVDLDLPAPLHGGQRPGRGAGRAGHKMCWPARKATWRLLLGLRMVKGAVPGLPDPGSGRRRSSSASR